MPELGIVSDKRKNLNSQKDYDDLLFDYEKTVIPNQIKAIIFINDSLQDNKRIALTCYEAKPEQCHRTRVANAVHNLEESIPLIHL